MENTLNANEYMAEGHIGKLMMKFSIPCIMSLLVSSLYNIVDQIFIGRGIGYLGNGATNIVFPVTIIALSLALLTGDGCAAYLSICQGMKDEKRAKKSVGNAVSFIIAVSLIFTVLLAFSQNQLLWAFGATEGNIGYAEEYFFYIIMGIPFFMFANSMNSIIRADGSPQFAMLSTLIGAIINVILDPVAIFVLHWGMAGAALATIAGQIVSALLAAYYLFHTKTFHLNRNSFLPDLNIMKNFLPLGISSFLTQISIVIIMAAMNNTLVTYGAQSKYGADIPLTVVGIVMKVFQIVIAVVVGIAAGSQPIIGYNYGAGKYARVKEIFKTMILAEACVGIIATICFEAFPQQIISIFGSESDLYNEFAVMAFRLYLSTILFCCIQKSTSIFLQALGKPFLSTGLSLLRDFILSVPLVLILPRFMGLTGALYSAPAADVVSLIAVLFVSGHLFRHLNQRECSSAINGPSEAEVCPSR
ncbi:MATE family efflux transporter [Clostridium sp. chh4-2]|uniref:MATE family efflux transporter n=1 Tax=Clostridium sp. chh4-2 TaxID=2067550 RepID=UPI000CCE3271|nr:MATE family efflux transporter [Clostridium sp. chh4-2]PNV60193.1 MATE family efflux transporter [Clostridium sp. chh4-2]